VSSKSLGSLNIMSIVNRRTQRVVTDSEDDFVEIRQRQRHDLQLSRRSQTPPIAEKDEDDGKIKSKRKPIPNSTSISYIHTAPIHVVSKPSVLSKEAPPVDGGYHGFIRLGSR
jgi:diacylglycerol O-acyltransferase-1